MSKNDSPLERTEMVALAKFLDRNFGERGWMHVPNEETSGVRSKADIVRLTQAKRQGLKPGAPDILIFNVPSPLRGIAIELKRRKGGKTSDNQAAWIQSLREFGWVAEVCAGGAEVKKCLSSYLKLKDEN